MSYPALASRTLKVPVSFLSSPGSRRGNCQLNMRSGLAWGPNKKKEHCVLGTSVPAVVQVWAAYRDVLSSSILSDCHLKQKGDAPLTDHAKVGKKHTAASKPPDNGAANRQQQPAKDTKGEENQAARQNETKQCYCLFCFFDASCPCPVAERYAHLADHAPELHKLLRVGGCGS